MSTSIKELSGRAFLAFPEWSEVLLSELKNRFGITVSPSARYGDLFYFEDLPDAEEVLPYWARTVMLKPFILTFESIGEASAELKKIQRNWAPYQFTCFRRANLIQEKLPYINLKDRNFPVEIPRSPIGLYTLIDEHTMIASAETTSSLPAGTVFLPAVNFQKPVTAVLKQEPAPAAGPGFWQVLEQMFLPLTAPLWQTA